MENILLENPWIILVIVIWTLPWKAVALWMSARRSQKIWFVVLLVLNTLAILDILYIFLFSKKMDNKNVGYDTYGQQSPGRFV